MYMSFVHYNRLNHNLVEGGLSLQGSKNGKIWASPQTIEPPAVATGSGLLPLDGISCTGCSALKSTTCVGTYEEG